MNDVMDQGMLSLSSLLIMTFVMDGTFMNETKVTVDVDVDVGFVVLYSIVLV